MMKNEFVCRAVLRIIRRQVRCLLEFPQRPARFGVSLKEPAQAVVRCGQPWSQARKFLKLDNGAIQIAFVLERSDLE